VALVEFQLEAPVKNCELSVPHNRSLMTAQVYSLTMSGVSNDVLSPSQFPKKQRAAAKTASTRILN
jgi:hypothetical protein